MTVQRFRIGIEDKCFVVAHDDKGSWILASDYDALAVRCAELGRLLKEAADEDIDCFNMGTDWHDKVRAALTPPAARKLDELHQMDQELNK